MATILTNSSVKMKPKDVTDDSFVEYIEESNKKKILNLKWVIMSGFPSIRFYLRVTTVGPTALSGRTSKGTTIYAEKIYKHNFTESGKKFVLFLH